MEPHLQGLTMNPTFLAAADHIRRMEVRIEKQKLSLERLRIERRDAADAQRRLALLHAALAEMRTQLEQLTPTQEQVAAPAWALPLMAPPELDETSANATA
jgi:hypothetical protein